MNESILLWIAVAVAAYLLYTWIDRRRWAGRIKITGSVLLSGGQSIDTESDPNQQSALARAAASRTSADDDLIVTLVAVPMDSGPAIVVRIGRETVARLPDSAEKRYMPVMRRLLSHNKFGDCRATIVAVDSGVAPATDAAAATPTYVLRLDLATPDKAIPPGTFAAEQAAS